MPFGAAYNVSYCCWQWAVQRQPLRYLDAPEWDRYRVPTGSETHSDDDSTSSREVLSLLSFFIFAQIHSENIFKGLGTETLIKAMDMLVL